ncbi:hypothetical protein PTKIN_Ptkin17bG0100500 [Pterospermum kingtungense]
MRNKSILRHAFNFRSISSSSSSPRFPLNRNSSSIPRKPFPFYTLQNPTLSRPFSDSPAGSRFPPLSDSEPPVIQKVELKEEDYAFLLEKPEGPIPPRKPVPDPTIEMQNLPRSLQQSLSEIYKPFAEEEPPPPPNLVLVKSEEDFDTALSKAEGESIPAVFYYTATWCVPCRFIGPVMEELARRNPTVTTYKMDIDEKALTSKLSALNITAVPTVHCFKGGKKEEEIVGADVGRIVRAMMNIYDMKPPPKGDSSGETMKDSKKDDSCEEK